VPGRVLSGDEAGLDARLIDVAVSRILVVHYALSPGGATRVAVADAKVLARAGFDVGFASEPGEWSDHLDGAAVRVHRLFFQDAARHPTALRYVLGLPLTLITLLLVVLRHRYDCLYLHHRQSSVAVSAVARLTGAAYVFIAHVVFSGGQAITRAGRHVLAVSESVRRNLIDQYGVDAGVITVMPNAVDTDVVRPAAAVLQRFESRWNIPADACVVACVALLIPQKAHDVLLRAWIDVAARCPGAVLVLAGDGPLRGELERWCAAHGIADRVRFLGMVDDMSAVYARASLIVLSSNAEGMPVSLLEAAAFGVPAVATAVAGVPEVIEDGSTGVLVPPGDPEALAAAIARLVEDRATLGRMGAAARDRVVASYSAGARDSRLIQYFRQI
jgi:glycosyltransferase involved in cell wall biosynthesis